MLGMFFTAWYKGLSVSAFLLIATSRDMPPLSPINPNTSINTIGKPMLNITAEGLLKIECKLPLLIASIALNWLYFVCININWRQNYPMNSLCKNIFKQHYQQCGFFLFLDELISEIPI